MLKIAILDDEIKAIDILSDFISKVLPNSDDYTITKYKSSAQFLNDYRGGFDILFLDICMPGMNGMNVAKRIRTIDSQVTIVFITSMTQYAVQGYEVEAKDYILKPYNYNDFEVRFRRILESIKSIDDDKQKVVIKTKDKTIVLSYKDIIFIESDGHYLIYHTSSSTYTVRETIKETITKFENNHFSLCNKCYIVNLRYVEKVDDSFVYLSNKEQLLISRLRKKAFMQALMDYHLRG